MSVYDVNAAVSEAVPEAVEEIVVEKLTGISSRRRDRAFDLTKLYEKEDALFKIYYRLDKEAFRDLVAKIKPILTNPHSEVIASSGFPFPVDVMLAITLRFLAGGMWPDISDNWGITESTMYEIIWKVTKNTPNH